MTDLINAFNLFDGLFLGVTALLVVAACRRGLALESLHTLIYLCAAVAGFIFMQQSADAGADPYNTVFLTINLGYFMLAAYLLTAVVLRMLGGVMMKTTGPTGMRGRLFAGLLALTKIVGTALLIHVWFIAHSPEANPERLAPLPEILRNSELVQRSDAGFAQSIADFLANHNLVTLPETGTDDTSSTETETPETSNDPAANQIP